MNAHSHSGVNVLAGYWVVIPAYNEATTIRDVASRALRQVAQVIVVDDGSTDGTAEALVVCPWECCEIPRTVGRPPACGVAFSRHWLLEPLES